MYNTGNKCVYRKYGYSVRLYKTLITCASPRKIYIPYKFYKNDININVLLFHVKFYKIIKFIEIYRKFNIELNFIKIDSV